VVAGNCFGAYKAMIGGTKDPSGAKRVQVRVPAVLGGAIVWARVCRPFGGTATLPQVGDEVLVVFEHGDPAQPYVIGSLW
jgi:uncharacterized protein involved in type VI secretion and phage assembly